MTTWPNWVDLVIITVLLRGCYSGFARGFLTELLNVAGAVAVTVLAMNYWKPAAAVLSPWLWLDPAVSTFLVFAGLFLGLIIVAHLALKRVADVIKWERFHWSIQGLGLMLGGLRGLWWAGVITLLLTSSGFTYLRHSVEANSVLGPRLVRVAGAGIRRIADRAPGAANRGNVLVPPMK